MANPMTVYQAIDKNLLGYGGKLYPSDMVIEARGAMLPEIRSWANIDERDPKSVSEHVIEVVTSCIRVASTRPDVKYSPKDLYEHDKMALLLIISQLTFPNDKDNSIYVKGECSNQSCAKTFDKLYVQTANLTYSMPDEKYEKYIDSEKGMFVIPTKRFGTIEFKPSTIGLGNAMSAWLSTFKPKFIKDNMLMFKLVQSLFTDWRMANDKTLRRAQIEQYNMFSADELTFRTQLVDAINVELKPELEYICPDCGTTFRCPMELAGGIKSLLMHVQSIDDELL